MFCPVCRSEYMEGIAECHDCHVALVAELTDPLDVPPIEFEEVLRTYNQADLAVIRSVLDDGEIEYFFRGEIFNLTYPLVQPARLFVRKDQAARVRELLGEFNVTFMGLSVRPGQPDDAGTT